MRRFCFVISLIVLVSGHVRIKRDDASYVDGVGGPVAQESQGESGGSSGAIDPALQAELAKLDPCESKSFKNSPSTNSTSSSKISQLPSRSPNFFNHSINQGQKSFELGFRPNTTFDKDRPSNFPDPEKMKAEIEKKFKDFVTKFNKTYPTTDDLKKALNFFKDNLEKLGKMLSQRRSPFDASFVITKFTDINFEGFKNFHLGALPPLNDEKSLTIDLSLLVKRPCQKLNWTSLEVIPPVRKQDHCGCCYAMSTADMVAAQYSIDSKNYSKHILSPQWISDCMPSPAGYKCNGGRPVKVLDTLSKKSFWRIPTESCYPYKDTNGTCRFSKNCTDTPEIKVKWGTMVNIEGPNEKELMAALLQHGPVVAVVGVTDSWQMYNGTGIIRPYQCVTEQNHAVLVTGYDYTGCVPKYTIKNSWGTDWGGRGYIQLEAGRNTCNIAKSIIFTCTSDDCRVKDHLKYVMSTSKHPECK